MKEALKEILRIVQTNGGLNKGDKIDITHCSGFWRIEELARLALRKEDEDIDIEDQISDEDQHDR